MELHQRIVSAPVDFGAVRTEFGLASGYPSEAVSEARDAVDAFAGDRADRREIPLVTIDPPGAMDLDQALYVERTPTGFLLYYAIADVAAVVVPGGPLDRESLARGQTLYLPDGLIPLHPQVLSEDRASLLPDQDRPAALWTIECDELAEPVRCSVTRALVRSRARLDYAGVQADADANRLHPAVAALPEFGRLRIEAGLRRGAINLRLPAQSVVRDDREQTGINHWQLVVEPRTAVDDWNEQVSLLTGMCAARIMLDGHNSAALGKTTAAPSETTAAVGETTAAPGETTAVAGETTLVPGKTTAAVGETTAAPGETTAVAGETTLAPGKTTAAVVGEIKGAVSETSAVVGGTGVAPAETAVAPTETAVVPAEAAVANGDPEYPGLLRTMPPAPAGAVESMRRTAAALGVVWPAGESTGRMLAGLDPNTPTALVLMSEATSLLRGASYTVLNGQMPDSVQHSAIGAPYAHVTAPLRRLADRYATEICLAHCAGTEVPQWVRDGLKAAAEAMRRTDAISAKLERACIDLTEATILASRVGTDFDATVLREANHTRPAEIFIPTPPVLAKCLGSPPEGKQVQVRLAEADPATRTVTFVYPAEPTPPS